MAAAAGALRQLLLPAIRRRLATGHAGFSGGTTMAQVHRADRCVRSYMTKVATHQESTGSLIRQTARAKLALRLGLSSIYAAGFALIYYGPHFPRKATL